MNLQTNPYSANDLSRSGIGFVWGGIYPPNEQHPFGYVSAAAYLLYGTTGDGLSRGGNINFYVDFASMAEYEAAVGLTYEPLTLTRVEDNPTETRVIAYLAAVRSKPSTVSARLGTLKPDEKAEVFSGSEAKYITSAKTYTYVKIKWNGGEGWIVKSSVK